MFSLTKFAAQNIVLGKSGMFKLLSSNYSQLVNKNVFLFASIWLSYPQPKLLIYLSLLIQSMKVQLLNSLKVTIAIYLRVRRMGLARRNSC
jgi:hypothetical protein